MSDVAPTGATSTGPQTSTTPSAPANGADHSGHGLPVGGLGGATKPSPAATRAADGRFLPKDSNQTPPPHVGDAGEQPTATEPPPKEPYRFKRAVKVFGQEEQLDLDEDGLAREVQLGRSAQKKLKSFEDTVKRAQRIIELAGKDPDGFYAEVTQKDPAEYARERVAREAQLAAMDANERRAYDAEQKLAAYEAQEQQRQEAAAVEQKQRRAEAGRQQLSATFIPALEKAGLPKTYETLYLMAETAKLALDRDGIEYSTDELAKETSRRLDGYTERYLANLDGTGLAKRLGPARVKLLLDYVIAEHLNSQEVVPARRQVAPIEAPAAPEEPISGDEVSRRLRAIRLGK